MGQKVWVLMALTREDDLYYLDDNDPVELEQFLGAHTTLAHAKLFARQVAEADRAAENDLIDEAATGEAHMPPVELSWARRDQRHGPGLPTRESWRSDTVEFANRGLACTYVATESYLDPELGA